MSKIEWTERSWNPIVGCAIVSPGCKNCYAMRAAWRMGQNPATPHYAGLTHKVNGKPVWTGEMRLHEPAVALPLRRKAATTWFVNSMSDLFAEGVKADWLDRVFAVMAMSPAHTFQILTKRPERMQAYLTDPDMPRRVWQHAFRLVSAGMGLDGVARWEGGLDQVFPLPNVWLGVSTEDQARADERIPHLLDTPAAVRWISAEPLLGPIDLYNGTPDPRLRGHQATHTFIGDWWEPGDDPKGPSRHGLDWVVVGGESGPDPRPMASAWARSLRDQCAAADVPFFFKQWGGLLPAGQLQGDGRPWRPHCETPLRGVKAITGRYLDGVIHDGMPG